LITRLLPDKLAHWLERMTPVWFLLPSVTVLAGITLYPFFYTLHLSLHRWELYRPMQGKVWVGLSQYADLFTSERFWNSAQLTGLYSGFAVSLSLLLGLLLALAVNHESVKMYGLIRVLLIVPLVMTPVVVGFLFRFMYNAETGIIPYILEAMGMNVQTILGNPDLALYAIGLCEVWYQTPFVFLILFAGLQAIPRELYEAASIDGASRWATFRYVTLPHLKFPLLVVVLFRTIDSFNKSFDLVYVMTGGGPGSSTEVFTIYGYLTAFQSLTMGKGAAIAILVMVLLIGLSMGLVKIVVEQQSA